MVKKAQQAIEELGLTASLGRRFAVIDDLTVNNILYRNKDVLKQMSDVFTSLTADATVKSAFAGIEEVPITKFITDILPRLTSIEVLLEQKHMPNFVSLIAPKVADAKTMFKWSNNFSWAYSGNIADSMKQRVKAAGGKVDGVLRFSIQWNDGEDFDQNDLDAHCSEPDGNYIYFPNAKRVHQSSGMLDVDIINPVRSQPAVENITWTDINRMLEGTYNFYIHNYNHCGGTDGFSAEIEYNGQIYSYEYNKEIRHDEKVRVATVDFDRKKGLTFIKSLPAASSSRTEWGLQVNRFHPVSVCMFSPNYWDAQSGIGNQHYFFMLKGCNNSQRPNGFFNEYLKEELLQHKRVFEALGSKMKVEESEEQLSGLGFSSTQRNAVTCKVEGHISRAIKIIF